LVIRLHTDPENRGTGAYQLLTLYTHGVPHVDCEGPSAVTRTNLLLPPGNANANAAHNSVAVMCALQRLVMLAEPGSHCLGVTPYGHSARHGDCVGFVKTSMAHPLLFLQCSHGLQMVWLYYRSMTQSVGLQAAFSRGAGWRWRVPGCPLCMRLLSSHGCSALCLLSVRNCMVGRILGFQCLRMRQSQMWARQGVTHSML
jgi:hypothetical protein